MDASKMAARANLDILFVADARFEGGASTALAAEIAAAAQAGLACGLMMVKGHLLGLPFPVHPDLRAAIGRGDVDVVDPTAAVEAQWVLVHHPIILAHRPTRPLRVVTKRLALILHHPARDAAGALQYDLADIVAHCAEAFDCDVSLAPVSGVVRDALPPRLPKRATLAAENWDNLIDPTLWPARALRPLAYPVAIGRHARPDAAKWPDRLADALAAYPADATRFRVRILGGGPFLDTLYGELPQNWEQEEFAWDGVAEFLQSLDFYVYFHSDAWSEAYGRTVLEALATGLVTLLPPHFEPLFGEAAVYCEPGRVKAVIQTFVRDPDAYRVQSQRARTHVATRCGLDQFVPRLNRLAAAESWRLAPATIRRAEKSQESVLFVSTNGIGLGHLTQQLAIARRLPASLTSVFATMSFAMQIAHDEGYLCHFINHHRHIHADHERWNRVFAEELFEIIAFCRPRVLAYDGTVPFGGLLEAMAAHRDMLSVWVRRPLWRATHAGGIEHSRRFDAVIEPGELADDFDHGPTKADRKELLLVPPVLHLDPAERLERAAARRFFGAQEGQLLAAVQLGSGNNFDISRLRAEILRELVARPEIVALDIRSPIEDGQADDAPIHPRHRILRLFPAFRYSRGFDFAVSAAGYNAFHEQVLGAVPTIFVPNEAPEMDLQLARAQFAELNGLGHVLRRDHDLYRIGGLIDALRDPGHRAEIARRCARHAGRNGAVDIADFIADYSRFLRTDYDVTKVPGAEP